LLVLISHLASAKLVLTGISKHGAYAGHVITGAGQNMAFHIIVGTPGVAVGRIGSGLTDFLNENPQANRQLLVITAQAAILFRIAGKRTGRDHHASKKTPPNQANE
jgi:hypothetical protein